MKSLVRRWRAAVPMAALALGTLTTAGVEGLTAQEEKRAEEPAALRLPVTFTALAANLNANIPGLAAQTLLFTIERWTTDAQQEEIFSALREKGQDAMLKVLLNQPRVGFLRSTTSLGYDLRFARVEPWGDGGYRFSLMTDRYIGFAEAATQPRTMDYRITLVDLRIKNNGKGEGTLSPATKMVLVGNMLVVENYEIQPILLQSVQMKAGKK